VLRTRSPRAHSLYCYRKLRVRLACVKHAASVRSEPGSNSRLKLVLPPARLGDFHRGRAIGNELCRSVFSQIPFARRSGRRDALHKRIVQRKTKRVLACFIRLSKSWTSWPAGRSTDKQKYYGKRGKLSRTTGAIRKETFALDRQFTGTEMGALDRSTTRPSPLAEGCFSEITSHRSSATYNRRSYPVSKRSQCSQSSRPSRIVPAPELPKTGQFCSSRNCQAFSAQ
jgi:hypothetical protein